MSSTVMRSRVRNRATAARKPGAQVVLAVVVFWLSAMLVGSHAHFVWEALHGRIVAVRPDYVEWVIYLAALLAVSPAVRRSGVFRAIGRTRQVVLAGLVWSMLAGQVAGRSLATYPFVTWSMYSAPDPPATYVEFRAHLASGRSMAFPMREVVPVTTTIPLRPRILEVLEASAVRGDERAADRGTAGADAVARLIDAYNLRHPDDPVLTLEVVRHTAGAPSAAPDAEVLAVLRGARIAGEAGR